MRQLVVKMAMLVVTIKIGVRTKPGEGVDQREPRTTTMYTQFTSDEEDEAQNG